LDIHRGNIGVFAARFYIGLCPHSGACHDERDALWLAASPAMRERLLQLRATDDYTYLSLQEIALLQASQDEEQST